MEKLLNNFPLLYKHDGDCVKLCAEHCDGKCYKKTAWSFSFLLPGETNFISGVMDVPKEEFSEKIDVNGREIEVLKRIDLGKKSRYYSCFFLDEKTKKCGLGMNRPVDCRTYPVIASKKDGKLAVEIDKNCPISKPGILSKEFVENQIKTWKQAKAPAWWWKIYSNHKSQGE